MVQSGDKTAPVTWTESWYSVVSDSTTLRTAARQAPLSSTISCSLFKLTSIESVMLSNHLILSRPLLLLPSVFPSIRVFTNELSLRIRWPKYWHFSFSFSPSSEYSGLVSFRIDWFDLIAESYQLFFVFFFFLVTVCMQDLSSLTRVGPVPPAVEALSAETVHLWWTHMRGYKANQNSDWNSNPRSFLFF